MQEEYKGLFENTKPVDEPTKEQSTTPPTETETTSQPETVEQPSIETLVAKITKVLDEKVNNYIQKLKDIEQQQKDIQAKIVQQYKETLASEITDDKLKAIIFKGVK